MKSMGRLMIILLVIMSTFGVVLAEDTRHEINKHNYSYSSIGNEFDHANEKGRTECMRTYIGVCDDCGTYYYTNVHLYWYEA
ncbi:hypothetical protein [Anaerorhabdus sp.]|jgi:hypothetical protein|uniref:hypothetical protein n=1 Tax=Anaerorhabdus sp. TaxID=1872524 RepID=UPI002FCC3F6F